VLADFMLTPKQQRILATFLLKPTHSFAISDIFERVAGGRSSTQAFIKTLVDARVLLLDNRHRWTGYIANTSHPLYPELRQIAIKSFGIREPIEEALASLTGTVERAFIFGSIAKGTDRPDSDIDVMVVGELQLAQLARAMDEVSLRLGREVHLSAYARTEWDELCLSDPVVWSIAEGPKLELRVGPVFRRSEGGRLS
jgi:predicted nucleotidyltransferase